MSLPSIVLTPFVGVHDLPDVSHYGGLVETLLERVSEQGPWHGVVTVDPTMDM